MGIQLDRKCEFLHVLRTQSTWTLPYAETGRQGSYQSQNGDLLGERGGKARATSKRWLSCHCVRQEYTNQRPFWYSTVPWRSSRDGVRILSCYYGEPKTMVGITSRMQIARLRVIVSIGYLCLCLIFYENLITILYFFIYNCDNYRQEALYSFNFALTFDVIKLFSVN